MVDLGEYPPGPCSDGCTCRHCGSEFHQQGTEDLIQSLQKEADRWRKRSFESDDQLVHLAGWCARRFGVENNTVIGRDGWPNRLGEVVIKAVEDALDGKENGGSE